MVRCIFISLVFLLCQLIARADDVYLKSGFVYRNVRVVDTTGNTRRVASEKDTFSLPLEAIAKIERHEVSSDSKAQYELYSEQMYREYQLQERERQKRDEEDRARQLEQRSIVMEDSVRAIEVSLNRSQPWRNSVFLAAGWGSPQGARFELGYNIGSEFALGIIFGMGDTWSKEAKDGTLGVFALLRFPKGSWMMAPHVLFCTGRDLSIAGGADTYTLSYLGATVPLQPWLQLRPEAGLVWTSKHVSGGTSLFGGSTPEVRENTSRFGSHLSLEIDLRQVFSHS